MSIASRITSIEEHLKESYQELEGIGIDTTGVNNNLENIPKLLDGYWETLPKVTDEGTSITLDNTKDGKMKVLLKGNTYQNSTSGINLFCPDAPSKTQVGITVTNNGDGTYTINGTATANLSIPLTVTSIGKELTGGQPYTMAMEILSNGGSGGSITVEIRKNGTPQYNFFVLTPQSATGMKVQVATPSEDATIGGIAYYCGSGAVVNNLKIRPYLVKGSYTTSTIPPYEPYTNGASPNPDYPQDIHVVSGDNSIVVGNAPNLFNMKEYAEANSSYFTYSFDTGLTAIAKDNRATANVGYPINVSSSTTYYIKADTDKRLLISQYNSNNVWIMNNEVFNGDSFKPNANASYIRIKVADTLTSFPTIVGNVYISTSSDYTGESYPISLGDIELLKIGTYQDKIDKSTGKNLFDKDNPTIPNADMSYGQIISKNDTNCWFFEVDTNKTYTLTKRSYNYGYIGYSNTKPVIGTNLSNRSSIANETTITINPTDKYLCIFISKSDNLDIIQLEEGTATSYEPYGNVWYLNKQIRKVILDGTENWETGTYGTNSYKLPAYPYGYMIEEPNKIDIITNLFKGVAFVNRTTSGDNIIYNDSSYFYIRNTSYTSLANFKTMLGTNNMTLYYILATPTYTKIEGELLSQLNALAKSYASQTNISQENNDIPFILDITALKEME